VTDLSAGPKVGLFFDLRNPKQWASSPADHLARNLEVIEHAETLGAESIWATEHHLFDDGYLSQPLVFAAAVAARTKRVRVGTGILLAPLHHPRHIAEQAALVDAISGGRFELGLGAGYVASEFEAFGAKLKGRFGATDRVYSEVQALLAEEPLSRLSVQHPLPIWLGYQGPKNAVRAGTLGAGLLTLNRGSYEPYRNALEAAGHGADSARMGGVIDLIVARDPEAAWATIRPHYEHMALTYLQASVPGATLPDGVLASRFGRDKRGAPIQLSVLTPDEAVTEIRRRITGLPVEHVYCWASIAGMPGALVDEHLELLFGEVAPQLRASATES
jgi:alkanesulfonate monooxygenase SsuD/methylene tetrahydromethanopterin reductase-like flavin-dependent oxidoreductase (luciferase family)